MSDSNNFAFFGIPDNNFSQINLHHKKVSDSRNGHMHQNFPLAEILDQTNIHISNWVAFQNLQNTSNLTRSCGDLKGQPSGSIYGGNIGVHDLGITTRSVESLDCLLSATYTNTDTSIEDDGISSIFSDGRSLCAFGASSQVNGITSVSDDLQISSVKHANQACFSPSGVQYIHRTMEETATSHNLDSNISRIQENPLDYSRSSDLKTVGSCITVGKESGTTSLIPDFSNTTKKRNLCESRAPSYYFHDADIYSESDCQDFQLFSEKQEKPKRHKSEKCPIISFQQPNASKSYGTGSEEQDSEAIAQMKDIIYGAAAFRPVNFGVEDVEKPKRKNVKISNDPQTVAARQRRERISERIRVLQNLVPGGSKMDTASMLDEAANYLKFLRTRVTELEALGQWQDLRNCSAATFACSSSLPFFQPLSAESYYCLQNPSSFNHQRS